MIKAVFFDIDGTLVSFETHAIPKSTLDAIAELRKKDIKIFIATGRAYSLINNLGDLVFDGYITLNGGYCTTADHKLIYKNSIKSEDIDALIHYQQEVEAFPCMFVCEDELFMNFSNENLETIEKLINFPKLPIQDIEYARGKEIFQMMPFFDLDKEDEIMKNVFPNCDTARWNPLFTDIVAKGNSKQVGIDKVLAYYNISLDESMCFGDGGNDISMLQHTPISVAMGNATDEVKQYATYVTDSVDNDGIWNALKHLRVI